MESHRNPQTNQAVNKTGCSLQTDGDILFLRTIPTQLNEHGEVELVPIWRLHPYLLVSLVQEVTLQLPREKCKYEPSHKIFELPGRYARAMVVQNPWE